MYLLETPVLGARCHRKYSTESLSIRRSHSPWRTKTGREEVFVGLYWTPSCPSKDLGMGSDTQQSFLTWHLPRGAGFTLGCIPAKTGNWEAQQRLTFRQWCLSGPAWAEVLSTLKYSMIFWGGPVWIWQHYWIHFIACMEQGPWFWNQTTGVMTDESSKPPWVFTSEGLLMDMAETLQGSTRGKN